MSSDAPDPSEMDEEFRHYYEVLSAFREYGMWMSGEMIRRKNHFQMLPDKWREMLPDSPSSIGDYRMHEALVKNVHFLNKVVIEQERSGLYPAQGPDSDALAYAKQRASPMNLSKIKSTLHQIAREWSEEGAEERTNSFKPAIDILNKYLPVTAENKNKQKVLVPGCGLGRLPFDLVLQGYAAQGNEFSLQMLFTSHWILNCIPNWLADDDTDDPAHADNEGSNSPSNSEKESSENKEFSPSASEGDDDGSARTINAFTIHPWIHDPCNHLSVEDMIRPVRFPDIAPSSLGAINPDADFSMVAGEFLEVYDVKEQHGKWDAVVTCFFLDTAPIVFQYIEVIEKLLKPGGIWINLGPLLYHWYQSGEGMTLEAPRSRNGASDDPRYQMSIELTYDEILQVIRKYSFTLLEEGSYSTTYASNNKSMMQTLYNTRLFVVKKNG